MRPELACDAKCTGCSACFAACAVQAVQMLPDHEGFLRPQINESLCVGCGACARVCPALGPVRDYSQPLICFVARRVPKDRRHESASGGAFASVAQSVMDRGGVVYGAAFCREDWAVHHVRAASGDELLQLLGSKYVQSDVGDVYRQVREDLSSGKLVLFSGTPCQIAGLKAFLGGGQGRLVLAEVVCNSVPSPAWWKAYVAKFFRGGRIEFVKMRGETDRRPFLLQVQYVGRRRPKAFRFLTQLYSMVWMGGWGCRPSCLKCESKGRSGADLSFGDAWGVQELAPWGDDGCGLSEVVCWTERGRELVAAARACLEIAEVPFERVLRGNRWIRSSLNVEWSERLRRGRADLFAAIAANPATGIAVAQRLTATRFHQRLLRWISKKLSVVVGKASCHV